MAAHNGYNGRITTWIASLAAAGTLALTLWNGFQENQRQQICDNVNRINNMLEAVIREATAPEAGETPAERRESERLREFTMREIQRARCAPE